MDEPFKLRLEQHIAQSELNAKNNPSHYDGNDWWQLNTSEQEVIGIDQARWPRMMETWHCFEAFIDVVQGSVWDDEVAMTDARKKYPQLMQGDSDCVHFAAFVKQFGDISYREIHAVLMKIRCWERRVGVRWYADER